MLLSLQEKFLFLFPTIRRLGETFRERKKKTDRRLVIIHCEFEFRISEQCSNCLFKHCKKIRLHITKRLLRQDGVQPHFSCNFKAFLNVTSLTVGLVVEDLQTGQQVHLT